MLGAGSIILYSNFGVESKLDGMISSTGSNTYILSKFDSWVVSHISSICVSVKRNMFLNYFFLNGIDNNFIFGGGKKWVWFFFILGMIENSSHVCWILGGNILFNWISDNMYLSSSKLSNVVPFVIMLSLYLGLDVLMIFLIVIKGF